MPAETDVTEPIEETIEETVVQDEVEAEAPEPTEETDETDATEDSAPEENADEDSGEDTPPEEESQVDELDPALIERAAKHGLSEDDLRELGDAAPKALEKIERIETLRYIEAGKEAAPEPERAAASEPEPEPVKETPEPESDIIKSLEDLGYDEEVIKVFKTQQKELDGLKSQVQGFFQEQSRRADMEATKAWRESLPKEYQELLKNPEIDAKMKETVNALDAGYFKIEKRPMEMRELLEGAFAMVARDDLVKQAKEQAKKETLDAAERRSATAGVAPAGRTRRNVAPDSRESVIREIDEIIGKRGMDKFMAEIDAATQE